MWIKEQDLHCRGCRHQFGDICLDCLHDIHRNEGLQYPKQMVKASVATIWHKEVVQRSALSLPGLLRGVRSWFGGKGRVNPWLNLWRDRDVRAQFERFWFLTWTVSLENTVNYPAWNLTDIEDRIQQRNSLDSFQAIFHEHITPSNHNVLAASVFSLPHRTF